MTANIHSKLFFKNAFSAAQCFPVLLFVILVFSKHVDLFCVSF